MNYKIESGEDHLYVRGTFKGLTQFLHSREICEEYRFFPFYIMLEEGSLQAFYHQNGKGHSGIKKKYSKEIDCHAIQAQINTEPFPNSSSCFRSLNLYISVNQISEINKIISSLLLAADTIIESGLDYNIEIHFNSFEYIIPCRAISVDQECVRKNILNALSKMIEDFGDSDNQIQIPHSRDPEDRAFIYYRNGGIYTGDIHDHIINSTLGKDEFDDMVRGEIYQIESNFFILISMVDGRFLDDLTIANLIPKLKMYLEIYPDIFLDFKASPNSTFMPKYLRDYFTEN